MLAGHHGGGGPPSHTYSSPMHANSIDYHPNLNRPVVCNGNGTQSPPLMPLHNDSDTDSLRKPCWSDLESNLKGSYYDAAKIHNGTRRYPACLCARFYFLFFRCLFSAWHANLPALIPPINPTTRLHFTSSNQ